MCVDRKKKRDEGFLFLEGKRKKNKKQWRQDVHKSAGQSLRYCHTHTHTHLNYIRERKKKKEIFLSPLSLFVSVNRSPLPTHEGGGRSRKKKLGIGFNVFFSLFVGLKVNNNK